MKKVFVSLVMITLMLLSSAPAWAIGPATPELSFQQAIDRAIANSKTLQTNNNSIDRAKDVRDKAAENVTLIPEGTDASSSVGIQDANNFTSLVQADLNWQIAKKNYDSQQDSVAMQVYNLYDGLLQAQEKVNVAELQLKSAKIQRTVAEANARVGILSQTGLIQARSAAETSQSNLDSAKKSLDDSYQQFNQLMGLEANDRPVLTTKAPDFTELKVDDLDAAVNRAIDASPSVWTADQQITLANLALDLYQWNSATDPYDAKKIDVTNAELSAGKTKDSLENSVRSIYYKIKQLEEQYASAQQSVKVDEENLRVTKLKYEIGMAVESDVIAAEVTLANDNETLLDTACQHDILCYAFNKPWAYASSGSSGSSSSGGSN